MMTMAFFAKFALAAARAATVSAATGCDVKRRGTAEAPVAADEGGPAALAHGTAPVTGPGGAVVRWRPEPQPIPLNQWFAVDVELTPPGRGRLLGLDAQMPAHGHGMNVRPDLFTPGPGRLRAEGLIWHMPGDWELAVDVEWPDGSTATVRWQVPCCDG